MFPDGYQVEVLYYLNPHLLWIEVIDPSVVSENNFVFEQIGLYSLLPLEPVLDVEEEKLKTRLSEKWLPAALTIIKKELAGAQEVWFSPTYIDRRSSIFDDNIHKYGELFLKKNNKFKSLSKTLVKSGFAIIDTCLFHQELSSGKLKTKLRSHECETVIKEIENYYRKKENPKQDWENSVRTHTAISQATQELESALTEGNLKKHNNCFAQQILQNKINDFELCKGFEEESVGRAYKTKHKTMQIEIAAKEIAISKHTAPNLKSTLLKKKLDLMTSKRSRFENFSKSEKQILKETKEFLEFNTVAKIDEKKHELQMSSLNNDLMSNECNDHCNDQRFNIWTKDIKEKKLEKSHKKDENPSKKIRVCYGPPGVAPTKLSLKVMIQNVTENPKVNKNLDRDIHDTYRNMDSDVEIEITNESALMSIQKDSYNNIKCAQSSKSPAVSREKKINIINKNSYSDVQCRNSNYNTEHKLISSRVLQKKLKLYESKLTKVLNSSLTHISSCSDTTNKDSSTSLEEIKLDQKDDKKIYRDSDDEDLNDIVQKINEEYSNSKLANVSTSCNVSTHLYNNANIYNTLKNCVNPFKNIDPNISLFVDKLVTPVMMVHTKMNKRIEPVFNIRDVNFNSHIQVVLKNMSVERPMMLQTISWFCVLRGYSTFLISPAGSGKTLGYLPAVCRLLSDSYLDSLDSVGPTCIIVCATAKSVCAVEKLAKKFLGAQKKVLSCYSGVDESHVTMSLLNGCDLLISTPSFLVKLLQASDFGIDLRRLATFVFDDCERLGEVYGNEVKFIIFTIKETLKNRINKELKVQYIVASRQWCDFMKPLAKKAPYSVVCIGAFQECVLYSKACMTVNFVQQKNKVNTVHEFLDDIDLTKKIVIVCRTDEEIIELKKSLRKYNNTVFACDSTMSIQDMHHLRVAWDEYEEPLSGPILLGCDDTLTHLNVTDANYLLVYSLPNMFSSFCRQFSVLNDNYPSIFNANKATIKIKILIEESNLEQLPKICEFIKRCTDNIPHYLSELCKAAVVRKDVVKASNLVPICDNLLGLGHCSDTWNCHSRHTVLKDYDNLKEWIPTSGITTFKILHYHSAVHYSARLLSKTVNTVNEKYPQTYSTLSLKMGLYYSKESNRKPHVAPKVGDICAVAIKQNFFVRCQVMKILTKYDKGNPNHVLINLIDEERLEKTRDIYLYYLPDDLKNIQTYVVQVRLANVQPKDKDVTFSDLATDQLRKITDEDEDLYLRSQVVFGIGNTIFVDTLEACQDLALNKTVVKHDFKHVLLERHAVLNTNHLNIIKKLCEGKIHVDIKSEICEPPTCPQTIKTNTWAYLEKDAMSLVYFGSAISPDIFFVRLEKFDSCLRLLLNEIQKFVRENGEPLNELKEGNIVLAMFPDDATYERARIDVVIDENKVNCFFVDQGDWREVSRQNIVAIKEEFITRLPFQAIECRLVGVKPVGCQWTDFSTNWFCDKCYDDSSDTVKSLYVKYFTKEEASFTEGNKYSVLMIDTNSDQDVIINQLLIDVNLATENVSEIKYLNEFTVIDAAKNESLIDKLEIEEFKNEDCINDDTESCSANRALVETNNASVLDTIFKQPIRSVLLVGSDEDSEDSERWNINMMDDFLKIFKPVSKTCGEKTVNNLPALKNCVEKSVNNLSSSKNCGNKPVNNLFTSKNCEEKPVNNSPASTNCEKNPVKNLPTSKNCEEPDNNLFTSKNCEKQPVNNSPASINCEKKPANNSPISKNCEEKPVTNLPAFTNCEVKPVNNLQDSKNRGKVLINSLSVSKNCEDELSNCSSVSKNCGEELFSSVSVSKNCGEELSNSSSVSKNCGEELSNSSSISKNCGEDLSNSSSVYKNCEEELFNSLSASKNCEEKHFNFAPGIATNQSKNETEKMIEKNLSNKYNKVLQLKKISQELDSDDLTSSESSDTVQTPEKRVIKSLTVTDPPRKPRLVWRQNKNVVSIKIILIGLQMYDVKIQGRSLSFAATLNDVDYAFDIKLYGTVDVTKSHHSNKSQYILVQLYKILNKTWLTLTNDGEIRKWIVYDAESIDASSDEDDLEERKDIMIHVINNNCIQDGSDSEDENFVDDF